MLDLVQAHRSTIVFANSRRLAERLTSRLNELAYERATGEEAPPGANAGGTDGAGRLRRRRCPRTSRRSPRPTTARCPASSARSSRRR